MVDQGRNNNRAGLCCLPDRGFTARTVSYLAGCGGSTTRSIIVSCVGGRLKSIRSDPIRVHGLPDFFFQSNSRSAHAKVYNDAMKEIDLRKWLMVLFFFEDIPEFLIEFITAFRNPEQV